MYNYDCVVFGRYIVGPTALQKSYVVYLPILPFQSSLLSQSVPSFDRILSFHSRHSQIDAYYLDHPPDILLH